MLKDKNKVFKFISIFIQRSKGRNKVLLYHSTSAHQRMDIEDIILSYNMHQVQAFTYYYLIMFLHLLRCNRESRCVGCFNLCPLVGFVVILSFEIEYQHITITCEEYLKGQILYCQNMKGGIFGLYNKRLIFQIISSLYTCFV